MHVFGYSSPDEVDKIFSSYSIKYVDAIMIFVEEGKRVFLPIVLFDYYVIVKTLLHITPSHAFAVISSTSGDYNALFRVRFAKMLQDIDHALAWGVPPNNVFRIVWFHSLLDVLFYWTVTDFFVLAIFFY